MGELEEICVREGEVANIHYGAEGDPKELLSVKPNKGGYLTILIHWHEGRK